MSEYTATELGQYCFTKLFSFVCICICMCTKYIKYVSYSGSWLGKWLKTHSNSFQTYRNIELLHRHSKLRATPVSKCILGIIIKIANVSLCTSSHAWFPLLTVMKSWLFGPCPSRKKNKWGRGRLWTSPFARSWFSLSIGDILNQLRKGYIHSDPKA